MQFKRELLSATSATALMLLCQSAHAGVVGTIIGAYDSQCLVNCGSGGTTLLNGTTLKTYSNNGGNPFDTPSLYIENTGSTPWTNVTITLTGYQDKADGGSDTTFNTGGGPASTTTLTLPNIAGNSIFQLIWSGGSGGGVTLTTTSGLNLFTYDYDDLEGGTASGTDPGTKPTGGNTCGSGSGTATNLCSYVGNFDVKFSALLGGQPIAANFSPDNTQGGGNVAGTFVGWVGLDADGFSETHYDAHSLTFPGTLAVITTGTQGLQTTVPEPGTLALFGGGLGALGLLRRRRKRSEPTS